MDNTLIILTAIIMALVLLSVFLVYRLSVAIEYRKELNKILVDTTAFGTGKINQFSCLWDSIELLHTKKSEELKKVFSLNLYKIISGEILITTTTSGVEGLVNTLKFAMDGTSVESLRSKYAFHDPEFVILKQLLVERFTTFFQKEWEVIQSRKEQGNASTDYTRVRNLHNSYVVLRSLFSETEIQGVVKHLEKMKEFALSATFEEIKACSNKENYEDIILEYAERNRYLVDKKKVLQQFHYVFNKDPKPLN